MIMTIRTALLCTVVLLCSQAIAVTIDFDTLADTELITNQFPEVSFTTVAGQEIRVSDNPANDTPPNIICTFDQGGSINCLHPVFVDFTNPVNDLVFEALAINQPGVQGTVFAYDANGLLGSVDLVGGPNDMTVDFSALSNVTRVEMLGPGGVGLLDPAGAGIGWDTFRFTVVPEPSSAFLMLLAFLVSVRSFRHHRHS